VQVGRDSDYNSNSYNLFSGSLSHFASTPHATVRNSSVLVADYFDPRCTVPVGDAGDGAGEDSAASFTCRACSSARH
jgi:hypothetical protein